LDAAQRAAAAFLEALGVEIDGDVLRETPRRMALAYAEFLTPHEFVPTVFEPVAGYERMIMMRNVPFVSLCEHHALPFEGTADVAYLPRDRVAGLSKLVRVVDFAARRPQMQERLTTQVADLLEQILDPYGVAVRLQARHMCVSIRGVRAAGAVTVTSVLRGQILQDPVLRLEWLIQCTQARLAYDCMPVQEANDGDDSQ
jgi:GTP cyclohydrolase I